MSEQNKALYRRILEEVWNQGKLDVIDELWAADSVTYDASFPGGRNTGPEGSRQFVETTRAAFSDLRFTIHDQIAEGDKVVTRWTMTGAHRGALMGIAPAGKRVTATGISIARFQAGRLVESWNNWDRLTMLQQLGALPSLTAGTLA
mgnify:CR=1 FL=1